MPKPYLPNDTWSKRAAAEGYRARSVYKIEELDRKFHLLQPGMTVLDLGSAPGSWLQYISKRIGPSGLVVGVDIAEIPRIESSPGVPAKNTITIQHDITDGEGLNHAIEESLASEDTLKGKGARTKRKPLMFSLVISDAMASTSGIKDIDQWKSVELAQAVTAVAKKYLRPGGMCALKIFRGADFDAFLASVKKEWRDVKTVTVKASRDRSREVYLVMRAP